MRNWGQNLKSDPSELSVAKSKYNPGGKRGSKAKLKSGSVSSPSNSSNSSPESAIFSPSKQNPDKKQRSKPKPKSRSFHSPPDSSNWFFVVYMVVGSGCTTGFIPEVRRRSGSSSPGPNTKTPATTTTSRHHRISSVGPVAAEPVSESGAHAATRCGEGA
ncbi:hypothetical protein ACFX13_046896 [Malus domestica]